MSNTPKSDRAALQRLADALVEDILAAEDTELLAETGVDGDGDADKARAAFKRAAAPSRQASARRRARANVRALDPGAARRRLEEFIARDPETVGKLAAAARKEGKLSDEDVYGVLERLQERNAPEPGNRGHDGR